MSRLFILGSGGPMPGNDRHGESYVLQLGDDRLLFDCGPATTHKLLAMGMHPTQIDNLFFTHHHMDHDIDYPCFLLTRWDSGAGKENRLSVWGPKLTEQLTERILDQEVGAYAHDWIARINHPLSLNAHVLRGGDLPRMPPTLDVTDIGPGYVTKGKNWEVTSAPAEHVQPYLDSLAYRVDSDEGSFVFTGDTHPCDSVRELAKDADVMVMVTVDLQAAIDNSPEGDYMSGTTDTGKLAQEAGVKKLVLVHNTSWALPGRMEKGIAEIASVYDGEIVFGREMMEVPL
jgi:ribonuclease Z